MMHFAPTLYHSPFSLANALFDMTETERKSNHATDIIDAGDRVLLEIELPGYQKENIDVSLQSKYLTITAKPVTPIEGEAEVETKYLRRERRLGEFSCTYTVKNIEEEAIEVAYENGVLTVTLPKKQPIEPETRKFTIR